MENTHHCMMLLGTALLISLCMVQKLVVRSRCR